MKFSLAKAIVVFTASALLAGHAGAQIGDLIKNQGAGMLKDRAVKEVMDRLGKAMGVGAPIDLNQNSAFPFVTESVPDFHPRLVRLHGAASLKKPMLPGDYSVSVIGFCTSHGSHAPGTAQRQKLSRMQGKKTLPIGRIVVNGTHQGVSHAALNAIVWRIQDGISFDKMSPNDQAIIRRVAPGAEKELEGDYLFKIRSDYEKARRLSFGKLPPFEAILAKMGEPGVVAMRLYAARQTLMDQSISDAALPQRLFDTSDGLPYVLPNTEDPQASPWAQVRPGVVARLKVVEGVSGHNLLEFRVSPVATAQTGGSVPFSTGMTLASYRPRTAQASTAGPSLLDILGVGDVLGDRSKDGATKANPDAPGMLLSYSMAKQAIQPILVTPDYDDQPDDPDVSIKIDDVQMAGPSTLRITLSGDSDGQPVPVRIQSQINGTNVAQDKDADLGAHPYVDIDLAAKGVKRFRDNATFTINATATSGEKSASDVYQTGIYLPVIIVPGIDIPGGLNPASGGGLLNPTTDPGFGSLIQFLQSMPAKAGGHMIRFTSSSDAGFANVFAFPYARNMTPFNEAASELSARWEGDWSKRCYADRFNIIAHSQGTLVSRALLSAPSLPAYNKVKLAILAQGPHTGSGAAITSAQIWSNHAQLYPLWPWHKLDNGTYEVPSAYANPTLAALNGRTHNPNTKYVLCTSAITNGTVATARSKPNTSRGASLVFLAANVRAILGQTPKEVVSQLGNPQLLLAELIPGDLFVPTFSQLGEMYDPVRKTYTLIPAFARLKAAGKLTTELMPGVKHLELEKSPAFQAIVQKYLTAH